MAENGRELRVKVVWDGVDSIERRMPATVGFGIAEPGALKVFVYETDAGVFLVEITREPDSSAVA